MKTNIGGLSINYRESGKNGDTLVVLLHGWGANITLFDNIIKTISSAYRTVAPDMPGFGLSDEPKSPWGVDDYADFVLEFISIYSPKKVIFLGHSFGGRIIIKLMSRSLPFSVEKIILVDSAGIKPPKTLRQKVRQRIFKIGRSVLSLGIVKKLFPDALENLRKKNGSADYNAASPMMRQCLVKTVNEDLTALIPNISAETLLIWGTLDTATPISDGEKMERLIKGSGLVKIEGAGHYSFLDNPYLFDRVIRSFLNIS